MAGLVKHYQNTMKGIPQLTNNWGAMINLLDAVLVNGFNHVTILGLTKANTASITATINLGSDHGFIDRQVVRIAGSTNGWNGDYKILSADASSITIECTAEHPSVISGTATCFTAPLDFEIVHQTPLGSTEPKRAYRSKDPEALGLILLVHDFCVSDASTTGAKFAKVALVENMTDINVITGNQMPADPNNFGWDGIYHGRAKWYYRTSVNAQAADSATPSTGNSDFCITGNTKHFAYTAITPSLTSGGMLEFEDVRYGGKNAALVAQGINLNIAQNQSVYLQARSAFNLAIFPDTQPLYGGYNTKIALFYDEDGVYAAESAGKAIVLKTLNGNMNNAINTSGAPLLIPMPILTSADAVVGSLPFFKFGSFVNNTILVTDVGKVATFQHNQTENIYSKFAMTLEVE
ncbi:hypothetical protein [Acinetobacter indicus]|uniref:hypothetical protein n=1 Tax=Acinetobacter indicus TaxID=756892 RepID=UPI0032B3F388